MAEESKTEGKSPEGKAKKPKKAAAATTTAAAAEPAGESCRAPKCKQPVRAKGYCRKHFIGWRRAEVGKKHRYKVCSREACRKPRVLGGLCEEHSGKGTATPAGG